VIWEDFDRDLIPNPVFKTMNPALTPNPFPKLGRGEKY
jgi:hypothetical protein